LTATLQREVDAVDQKLKEDLQRLSSDIQVRLCLLFSIPTPSSPSTLPSLQICARRRSLSVPLPQLDSNARKEETGQELQFLDKRVMVRPFSSFPLSPKLILPTPLSLLSRAGPEQQIHDRAERGTNGD
jgi:hypothetical protein